MENKNSISLISLAFYAFLFLTPVGWVCLAFYALMHLHPVYWLYRIAKALEAKKSN